MYKINSKTHGILDYLTGILLVVLPLLLGWDYGSKAALVLLLAGVITLVYSLFTDYELGIAPVMHFKFHLGIDLVMGLLLAGSPWLLGFAQDAYLPHLVIGLFEIAVVAFTRAEVAPHVKGGV